ncbi:glycoside hydrolase family 32 protein [Tetragenococcus solitarius]|uniref:Sucrose-6-phosphate hydrolase n=1 Tax=Tetragenococcus solitarius TaxID=71453 RepID=A0ABN3Y6V6_9ENTE|nr:glycoside hydrolase family 32 protein [Tetragenococcus solitarius]
MYSIEEANQFIQDNQQTINKIFYPVYHFAPPIGWINDPNGVVVFKNELHLFYQHYPYGAEHGAMHWGHAKSRDVLHWEHLPVALAPDQSYDRGGVFSGSAIEKEGKLYIMYTGHLPNDTDNSKTRQNQNIAISEDGITFKKYEKNPVLTEKDIPQGSSVVDFRDPKIFEKDGVYYCVIGSKTEDDKGQVLLYRSADLLAWKYVSVIFSYNPYLGTMVECPDLLLFEDKAVFILSAMNYEDKNRKVHSHISWIIEGQMDWNSFKFQQTSIKEMDKGLDFYAPQTVKLADGRYLAIAWMQNWQSNRPTYELGHRWFGQMTLPRIITYKNGQLQQKVPTEIVESVAIKEEKDQVRVTNKEFSIAEANYFSLKIAARGHSFDLFFKNEENEFIQLSYLPEKRALVCSREHVANQIIDDEGKSMSQSDLVFIEPNEKLDIQIFLDRSSIEIFINEEETITNAFYVQSPFTALQVKSEDRFVFEKVKLGKV